MHSQKAYPYPQIVTGDDWHVLETTEGDSQPRTDNLNRQMYVPMDRECDYCGINHGRMIRRHELGHAKWSPKTMGKLMRGTRSDAIEALEEVRVNYLLGAKAKLTVHEYLKCKDEFTNDVLRLVKTGSVADIILYLLAAWSSKGRGSAYDKSEQFEYVEGLFKVAINDESFHPVRRSELEFAVNTAQFFQRKVCEHRWNQWPSYKKVQRLAEKLSVILNDFIDKPNADEIMAPEPQPGESAGKGEDEGDEVETQGYLDGNSELERRMRTELQHDMMYRTSQGHGTWGKMHILTPPMSVNLRSRINHGRAYRPMEYGYNPKYINRYLVDKKIFKQKQRVKGGTILIDASGSMSFSGQDILEIMMMLPAVNIAMYNGSWQEGWLHIIAKNGMRVNDTYLDDHSGGGNVVDGPALRWLSEMPERRIWVSDMKVFGAGDNSNGYNLLRDCYDICTQNKIINLKDIEEVKEHALKLNQVL